MLTDHRRGRFDHVHWQKHSAVKSWLLHVSASLPWIVNLFAVHSVPLSCAAGRRCGIFLQYDQSHHLSAPTHNTGSKCFAPVPAGWQRRQPPARPGYVGRAKSREHNAVAWVFVHRAELVRFILRQGTELGFPFSLAAQISQIGFGLITDDGFAESVKPAAFSITIRDVLHLLTSDPRENEKLELVPPPLASMLIRQFRPAPKNRNNRSVKVNVICR